MLSGYGYVALRRSIEEYTLKNTELAKSLNPATSSTVFASAGTGKTWLLISRILRLLLDGARPDSILAITFTNKAVGEIQQRLTQRLAEISFADPQQLKVYLNQLGIEKTDDYTAHAHNLYETILHANFSVQIKTFHSFCEHIIRIFPWKDVSTDATIVNESQQFKQQAYDRLLDETTQNPQGNTAIHLAYLLNVCNGIKNVKDVLFQFLEHCNDWLAYTKGKNCDEFGTILTQTLNLKDSDEHALKTFWTTEIQQNLKQLIDILTTDIRDRKRAQYRVDCLTALSKKTHFDLDSFFLLKKNMLKSSGESYEDSLPEVSKKNLGTYAMSLQTISADICSKIRTTELAILRWQNYQLNYAWYHVGDTILKLYQNVKNENGRIDFNDLEWTALSILQSDKNSGQQLQYRLSTDIKHILIDEFQDTNPHQWNLIKPLLEEIASQQEGSIFIVGDTKQSIYGFRGAEPNLQHRASQWLQEHMRGNEFTLEKSRRSTPAVIEFVNSVFENPQEDTQLSSFTNHQTYNEDLPGKVFVFDCFQSGESIEPAPAWRNPLEIALPNKNDLTEVEAKYVARTIITMKNKKIEIEEQGIMRPFDYKDVLILARQKTSFDVFTRALQKHHIPFTYAKDIDPFDSFEVDDVCALIEFLHRPGRNDLLARILLSPLFSFKQKDLLIIAKRRNRQWLYNLKEGKSAHQDAYAMLNDWINWFGRLPTHDLLDTIFDQTDLIQRYLDSSPSSRHKLIRNNFAALLELTLDYKSGRYPDASDFIHYIKDNVGGQESISEQSNCVRIMSIHAAKGLEAPVVFLVDTQRKTPDKFTYHAKTEWSESIGKPQKFLLFSRRHEYSNILDEFSADIKRRERQEKANLLYVALTRARQYIFISAAKKSTAKKEDQATWYQLLKDRYDSLDEDFKFQMEPDLIGKNDIVIPDVKEKDVSPLLNSLPPKLISEIRPSSSGKTLVGNPFDDARDGKEYGTVIHRCLELLTTDSEQNENTIPEKIKLRIYDEFPDHSEMLEKWLDDAYKIYTSPVFEAVFDNSSFHRVYNEVPLVYSDENGRQIYGIIDRLCVTDQEAWIIDYKTHNINEQQAEEFAESFKQQLYLYHKGVAKLFPNLRLRTSILFTSPQVLYDYQF